MSIKNIFANNLDASWKDIRANDIQCNTLSINGVPFTPIEIVQASPTGVVWQMKNTGGSEVKDSANTSITYYKIGGLVTVSFDQINFVGGGPAVTYEELYLQSPNILDTFKPLNPTTTQILSSNTSKINTSTDTPIYINWDADNQRFELNRQDGQPWPSAQNVEFWQISFTYLANDVV
jgi:hypothetical protein